MSDLTTPTSRSPLVHMLNLSPEDMVKLGPSPEIKARAVNIEIDVVAPEHLVLEIRANRTLLGIGPVNDYESAVFKLSSGGDLTAAERSALLAVLLKLTCFMANRMREAIQ